MFSPLEEIPLQELMDSEREMETSPEAEETWEPEEAPADLPEVESALRTWSRRVQRIPLLTEEEEIELARRAEKGDEEALWKLIESNQRLVFKIALRYARSMGHGLTFDDLLQEGTYGLIRAAQRFDPSKGCRFSTYATYWIQQAISRAVADHSRVIRLPAYIHEVVAQTHRTMGALRSQLGRAPTPEEVGEVMGIPPKKAEQYMLYGSDVGSLDVPMDEDNALVDYILDEHAVDPAAEAERKEIRERVIRSLSRLSPREQEVIRLRYGLEDGIPRTLREISKRLKLSRERVRQIEGEALQKLREDEEIACLN